MPGAGAAGGSLLGTAGVGSPAPRPHWRLVSRYRDGRGPLRVTLRMAALERRNFPKSATRRGSACGPGQPGLLAHRAGRRGGGGERPGQVGDVGNRAGPSPAPLPPSSAARALRAVDRTWVSGALVRAASWDLHPGPLCPARCRAAPPPAASGYVVTGGLPAQVLGCAPGSMGEKYITEKYRIWMKGWEAEQDTVPLSLSPPAGALGRWEGHAEVASAKVPPRLGL